MRRDVGLVERERGRAKRRSRREQQAVGRQPVPAKPKAPPGPGRYTAISANSATGLARKRQRQQPAGDERAGPRPPASSSTIQRASSRRAPRPGRRPSRLRAGRCASNRCCRARLRRSPSPRSRRRPRRDSQRPNAPTKRDRSDAERDRDQAPEDLVDAEDLVQRRGQERDDLQSPRCST